MLKIREVISLGASLLMLGLGIWVGQTDDWSESYLYFGIAMLIFLFYLLRRRLRIKMQEEQNK